MLIICLFCDRWESIGYRLKLTKSDISSIKDNNSDAEMRRILMLQTWKERFAHKDTYLDLIEALLRGGRAQQALNMCHKSSMNLDKLCHLIIEKVMEQYASICLVVLRMA